MGVAILFALFGYYSFNNMSTSKDEIVADNKVLQADVTVLKEYQANSEQTKADKVRYQEEMDSIIEKFPPALRPEDLIMYAQSFEQNEQLVVNSIDMPVPTMVPVDYAATSEVAGEVAASTAAEGTANNGTVGEQVYTNKNTGGEFVETTDGTLVSAENVVDNGQASSSYFLYNAPSEMQFQATYVSLKNIIKKINEDPMRKSFEELNIAFDEEQGVLVGTMKFSSYFLDGGNREYIEPVINGVGIGSKDIFRSADRIAAKRDIDPDAAKATEEADTTDDTTNKKTDKKETTED